MLFVLARSVCCVSELARAGLFAFPNLLEFRKLPWRRQRLSWQVIGPSEMRWSGSRTRGGLKGLRGLFKGPALRNWGPRNLGSQGGSELDALWVLAGPWPRRLAAVSLS